MELDDARAFLTREARLADEHRYTEWLALWDDEALYWVPCGGDDPDPETNVSIIYDDRAQLESRIRRLQTGDVPAQHPPSRLRRLLSGLEVEEVAGSPPVVVVYANFCVYEWRPSGTREWVGRSTHHLSEAGDGTVRIKMKKVLLINNDAPLPPLAFII